MKKFKAVVKWAFLNGAFLGLVLWGVVFGCAGASRFVVFIVWVSTICTGVCWLE